MLLDLVFVVTSVVLAILGFLDDFPYRRVLIVALAVVAVWGGFENARSNRRLSESIETLHKEASAAQQDAEFMKGQLSALSMVSAKTLERLVDTQPPGDLGTRALALSREILVWASDRRDQSIAIATRRIPPSLSKADFDRAWDAQNEEQREFDRATMRLFASTFQTKVHAIGGEFAARGVAPNNAMAQMELERPTNPLSLDAVARELAAMATRLPHQN